METHTSIAGIYKITLTLRDMNELLYRAAVGRRLRLVVSNLLLARRAGRPEDAEFQLNLLDTLAKEEGWLK